MDRDCTYGLDKLPPTVLSKCCYALACPIHTLFNVSLTLGIVPRIWKSSFVIPQSLSLVTVILCVTIAQSQI